jgi:hypothetical protein
MKKQFRKKPVVIEAIKFDRSNWNDVYSFTNHTAQNFFVEKKFDGKAYCTISTLEGLMMATEGDYIIKGVNGEFYPCKPDIFLKTYEEII